MSVLAFVVYDPSFDQNGLFSVELLVWFTRLDKLCGIRPPATVSMEGSDFRSYLL